jgi:hypothetical protein
LGGLIGYAAAQSRRPVLGCNRTWLRPAWIKARFGSYDVHVERDPVAIWASYKRHAQAGNYNYFTNLHLILERNGRHPLFAPMANRVRLRQGLARLAKAAQAYPALIDRMSDAESYGLVYYFWSLSGLSHCDLIVDTGAPSMAARATAVIKAGSGMDIDFSGIRPISAVDLAGSTTRAAERSIRAILPFNALSETCDMRAISRRLGDLSDAKADHVFALLDGVGAPRIRAQAPALGLAAADAVRAAA